MLLTFYVTTRILYQYYTLSSVILENEKYKTIGFHGVFNESQLNLTQLNKMSDNVYWFKKPSTSSQEVLVHHFNYPKHTTIQPVQQNRTHFLIDQFIGFFIT